MRRGTSRAALPLLAIDALHRDLSHDRLRRAISRPPRKPTTPEAAVDEVSANEGFSLCRSVRNPRSLEACASHGGTFAQAPASARQSGSALMVARSEERRVGRAGG